MIFIDRFDAGNKLAEQLKKFENENPLILALPRGGTPVAYVVAKKLHAPLDVLLVRKLKAPLNQEFGFGALAPGVCNIDSDIVRILKINTEYIDKAVKEEAQEMIHQQMLFRNNMPSPNVSGKTVIIVDDGMATGATAKAAVLAMKKQHAKAIIFASPVCAKESANLLESVATQVICLLCPEDFLSVSYWYRNFPQVSDSLVLELLKKEQKTMNHEYPYL